VAISKNGSGASNTTPTVTFSSSAGVACTWVSAITPTIYASTVGGGYVFASMSTCLIPSSGAETVQVACTVNCAAFTDISVIEFSTTIGTWANPVLDVVQTTASASSATCASGTSSTTTNANDLVVAACEGWNAGQTSWATVSGYTNVSTITVPNRNTLGVYWKAVTSTGTQSFTDTITADTTLGMLATFKVTTGAAGGCIPSLALLGVGGCG
jgi:hypothetical protein